MSMNLPTDTAISEVQLLTLAREIVLDLKTIEEVLKETKITTDQYQSIKDHPRFLKYLEQEQAAWGGSLNAQERIRVKSLAIVEEHLPEMWRRMNDPKEPSTSRNEVVKQVMQLAGLNKGPADGVVAGERISIRINLGQGEPLRIEKDITPVTQQVIEG